MPSPQDHQVLAGFLDSEAQRPLLGLLYGRRRIGKSTLLVEHTDQREGFYFEATRVQTPAQLDRLGAALGQHLGVGRIALDTWEEAIAQLLALGEAGPIPVVIDEFGHILEADRSVDSVLASAFGPGARRQGGSRARMVLCGSAIAVMRALTAGEAPLRGRAGMELVMQPDDFRTAAGRLDCHDLVLATRVYAVIGGVVGYATDMTNFDLPASTGDFDRWVAERVLSPASPLHDEATTLLAEDPTLAGPSNLLHHSILGAIANGSVTAGHIANRIGRQVSNLAPALNRLVDAGFVVRHADPLRQQRPLYALSDPYLQFHYAILERHRTALRARDQRQVWRDQLVVTYDSQVRGPVFEEQARTWVRRFADPATVGGPPDEVGPSAVSVGGSEHELDVVVAASGPVPSQREVLAMGEAKAGQTVTCDHLRRLEQARTALGPRAATAKLLLFGTSFADDLRHLGRADIELIDLDRLYAGT
ncbi:MAG TPA: hypothetical protein VGA36_01910 [Nitriliruptorales bacterium]